MNELILLAALLINIAVIIILAVTVFTLVSSVWNGAPYVPSTEDRVETMVRLSKIKKGEKMIDLGSGDGKIVIEFAKKGADAHGYEINLFLVLWSRWKIKKLGLQKNAHIHLKSWWKVKFSQYDVITIYALPYIMNKMKKRLQKELKPNARVLSNYFTIPGWKPIQEKDHVHVYTMERKGNRQIS